MSTTTTTDGTTTTTTTGSTTTTSTGNATSGTTTDTITGTGTDVVSTTGGAGVTVVDSTAAASSSDTVTVASSTGADTVTLGNGNDNVTLSKDVDKTAGATDDVVVGNGKDTVTLSNVTASNIIVDAGTGADVISATTIVGNLLIVTDIDATGIANKQTPDLVGVGQDSADNITVSGVTGSFTSSVGNGADSFNVQNVSGPVTITAGTGLDNFFINNTGSVSLTLTGAAAAFTPTSDTLNTCSSYFNEFITIENTTGNVTVGNGSDVGNAYVTIIGVTGNVAVTAGNGADNLYIAHVGGSVSTTLGTGTDYVGVGWVTGPVNITIAGAATTFTGNTALYSTPDTWFNENATTYATGSVTFLGGAGNYFLTFTDVIGNVVTSTSAIADTDNIYVGEVSGSATVTEGNGNYSYIGMGDVVGAMTATVGNGNYDNIQIDETTNQEGVCGNFGSNVGGNILVSVGNGNYDNININANANSSQNGTSTIVVGIGNGKDDTINVNENSNTHGDKLTITVGTATGGSSYGALIDIDLNKSNMATDTYNFNFTATPSPTTAYTNFGGYDTLEGYRIKAVTGGNIDHLVINGFSASQAVFVPEVIGGVSDTLIDLGALSSGGYQYGILVVGDTITSSNYAADGISFVGGTVTPPAAPVITSFSPDTGVVGDGITSATVITLTGTAVAGATISVYDGVNLLGTATASSGGTWTYTTPTITNTSGNVNGSNAFTATATNSAGTSGHSTALTVTIDTTPPAPTIMLVSDTGSSSTDGITNNDMLKGSSDPTTLVIIKDGSTTIGTTTSDSSGNWTFTPSTLAQGSHSFTATSTDTAGNTGTSSALAMTYDNVAPVVTIALVSDTGSSSTDHITNNDMLKGSSDPTTLVTIKDGSTTIGTTTSDSSGNWTFTPSTLAQGSHSFTATSTDTAGNTGTSSALSMTYDNVAPVVTIALVSDTGSSSTDGITNNDMLKGSSDPTTLVIIKDGSTTIGTTTSDSSGNWTFTPSTLAQGSHSFTATSTDTAGNTGTSSALAMTYDNVAPVVTIALVSDTGSSNTDGITNNDMLKGTSDPSTLVTILDGSTTIGTTTSDSSGNWTFTPSTLAQGGHSFTATSTDTAGNTGTSSALAMTYDNVAPVVTIALVSDTGSSSTDGITNNDMLKGSSDPTTLVIIKDGSTTIGTTTSDSSGNWTFTPSTLAQGGHSFTATSTDTAGNTGTSSALAMTYDNVAPVVTIALVSDTGSSNTDGITNNDMLKGTSDPSTLVTILDGSTTIGTTTSDSSGNWTFTPSTLAQGSHSFTATSTDTAGNTGTSSALAMTYDNVAPVVTIALVSDTGSSSTDGITNNDMLKGSSDPTTLVIIKDGSTTIGTTTSDSSGNWTFTPSTLAQGGHSFTATSTDTAGNTGTSSALAMTYDNVAPVVTIALVSDTGSSNTDGITNNDKLKGTSDPSTLVTILDGSTTIGTTTSDSSGNWTFTPSTLAQGGHSFTATSTDTAGNTGTSSALAMTYDNVAPVVTIALVSDTGSSNTDGITNNDMLKGSSDPTTLVTIKDGSTTIGTTTSDSSGNWTFTPSTLAQGSHSFTATSTDTAGNTGTSSALSMTYDNVAPTLTITSLTSDIGRSAGGDVVDSTHGVVNDSQLTGTIDTADAGLLISIYNGLNLLGTTTADINGNWSFPITGFTASDQGAHNFTASATDAAGNPGSVSMSFTYDPTTLVYDASTSTSPTLANNNTGGGTENFLSGDDGQGFVSFASSSPITLTLSNTGGVELGSVTGGTAGGDMTTGLSNFIGSGANGDSFSISDSNSHTIQDSGTGNSASFSGASTSLTIGVDDGAVGTDQLSGIQTITDNNTGGDTFDIGGTGGHSITGHASGSLTGDKYVFSSGAATSSADTITDFNSAIDTINLNAIDAALTGAGPTELTFTGTTAGGAHDVWTTDGGTQLNINTDGVTGDTNMVIDSGASAITYADLIGVTEAAPTIPTTMFYVAANTTGLYTNTGETTAATALATTVDSGTLSYMLTGTDAAYFTINNNGILSFVSGGPDYNNPPAGHSPSGGDEAYSVTVTATDSLTGLYSSATPITVDATQAVVNIANNTTVAGAPDVLYIGGTNSGVSYASSSAAVNVMLENGLTAGALYLSDLGTGGNAQDDLLSNITNVTGSGLGDSFTITDSHTHTITDSGTGNKATFSGLASGAGGVVVGMDGITGQTGQTDTLTGIYSVTDSNSSNDTFHMNGSTLNTIIQSAGTTGSDTFYIHSAGPNTITNNGTGSDTAIFSGVGSGSISIGIDGITGKTDTLTNVQTVTDTNGTSDSFYILGSGTHSISDTGGGADSAIFSGAVLTIGVDDGAVGTDQLTGIKIIKGTSGDTFDIGALTGGHSITGHSDLAYTTGDDYVFTSGSSSVANFDTITDFTAGTAVAPIDKIDLSNIDSGHLIYNGTTNTANSVWFSGNDVNVNDSNGNQLMEINLSNGPTLNEGDFLGITWDPTLNVASTTPLTGTAGTGIALPDINAVLAGIELVRPDPTSVTITVLSSSDTFMDGTTTLTPTEQSNGSYAYTFTGTQATDLADGNITFVGGSAETGNLVIVANDTATNGGSSAAQDIGVTVAPFIAPFILDFSGFASGVSDNSGVINDSTPLVTVSAPGDTSPTLTYSFGGNDPSDADFSITSAGIISVGSTPISDVNTTYTMDVTATDGGGHNTQQVDVVFDNSTYSNPENITLPSDGFDQIVYGLGSDETITASASYTQFELQGLASDAQTSTSQTSVSITGFTATAGPGIYLAQLDPGLGAYGGGSSYVIESGVETSSLNLNTSTTLGLSATQLSVSLAPGAEVEVLLVLENGATFVANALAYSLTAGGAVTNAPVSNFSSSVDAIVDLLLVNASENTQTLSTLLTHDGSIGLEASTRYVLNNFVAPASYGPALVADYILYSAAPVGEPHLTVNDIHWG